MPIKSTETNKLNNTGNDGNSSLRTIRFYFETYLYTRIRRFQIYFYLKSCISFEKIHFVQRRGTFDNT